MRNERHQDSRWRGMAARCCMLHVPSPCGTVDSVDSVDTLTPSSPRETPRAALRRSQLAPRPRSPPKALVGATFTAPAGAVVVPLGSIDLAGIWVIEEKRCF